MKPLILSSDMIDDPWGINRRLVAHHEARARGETLVRPHTRRAAVWPEVKR